jgi:hypothetical protein
MRESLDVGNAEECFEHQGMFDHEGLKRFAHQHGSMPGGVPAAICAGFYLGLAYAADKAD